MRNKNMSAHTHISKDVYDDACRSQYAYAETQCVYTQINMHTINHVRNPLVHMKLVGAYGKQIRNVKETHRKPM